MNTRETEATTNSQMTITLIHVPAQYDDPSYREWIYDCWLAEWQAAKLQLDNVNCHPYYGMGWRVD
jgi:hypothetical protein